MNRPIFLVEDEIEFFPNHPTISDHYNVQWMGSNPSLMRVYAYVYDRRNLEGSADSFSQFHDNNHLVEVLGFKQYPKAMAQLQYNLHSIVCRSKLYDVPVVDRSKEGNEGDVTIRQKPNHGEEQDKADRKKTLKKDKKRAKKEKKERKKREKEQKKKSKKKNKHYDSDGSQAEEGEEEDEKKKEEKKLQTIPNHEELFELDGVPLNRVEVGLETIKDDFDVVIGWRVFFFVIDPNIDLANGMRKQFDFHMHQSQLPNVRQRIAREDPSIEGLMICTAEQWMMNVLQLYCCDKPELFRDNRDMQFKSLTNWNHPLHLSKVFSFGRSCDIGEVVMPHAKQSYWNYDDYAHDGSCMRFPNKIKILDKYDRRPAVLHHSLLIETVHTRQLVSNYSLVGKDHAIRALQDATERKSLMYDSSEWNIVKQTAEAVEEIMKEAMKGGPKQVKKLRKSRTFVDRIRTLFAMHSKLPPGHRKTIEWIEAQKLKAKSEKKSWSVMRVIKSKQDKKMSIFANYIARCGQIFENVFGYGTLHQEMVMVSIWRLCAFDSRPSPHFPHLLFLGPAAAGKSHIQKTLMEINCPETCKENTHDTKLAWTVKVIFDGLIFIYDEMPENYGNKGDAGDGFSLFKTMLSNYKVEVNSIVHNPETRTRETQKTTCSMALPFFMNSNKTTDQMADPVVSRFLVHEVNRFNRIDVDFCLNDEEMQLNPKNAHFRDEAVDEFRIIHCLVACVELLVKTRFLTQVFQRSALLRWNLIKVELIKAGIILETRKDKHIVTFARCCCLLEAVLRVFTTETHFEKDKEFEYEDVLEVEPYLFVTEEHMLYAITACENSIADVNSDEIMRAFSFLCRDENDQYQFRMNGDEKNFNYFSFKVQGVEYQQEIVLSKAVNQIQNYIQRTTGKKMLDLSVKKNLQQLMNAVIESEEYLGEEETVTGPQGRPVLLRGKVKMCFPVLILKMNSSQQCSLDIHRGYLTSAINRPDGFLMDAIRNTQTRNTAERRMVIGKTVRSNEEMYPYIFKTFDAEPNKEKDTVVMNVKYRTPGIAECFDTPEEEEKDNMDVEYYLQSTNDSMVGDEEEEDDYDITSTEIYAKIIADKKKSRKDFRQKHGSHAEEGSSSKKKRVTNELVVGEKKKPHPLTAAEYEKNKALPPPPPPPKYTPEEMEANKNTIKYKSSDRYNILSRNIDEICYEEFLKERMISKSKKVEDFPVCKTWTKENAVYPLKYLAKAKYDRHEPVNEEEEEMLNKHYSECTDYLRASEHRSGTAVNYVEKVKKRFAGVQTPSNDKGNEPAQQISSLSADLLKSFEARMKIPPPPPPRDDIPTSTIVLPPSSLPVSSPLSVAPAPPVAAPPSVESIPDDYDFPCADMS